LQRRSDQTNGQLSIATLPTHALYGLARADRSTLSTSLRLFEFDPRIEAAFLLPSNDHLRRSLDADALIELASLKMAWAWASLGVPNANAPLSDGASWYLLTFVALSQIPRFFAITVG